MNNRHTITSFLLLVLAMPLLFLSFLQLKQAYIRHEMEERLEMGLQQTLFISKPDWKRHNDREIWVGGKLFDVKKMQVTADGFIVTGLFDETETAVLQQLQNTCAKQTTKDTPVFAQFFQLLQDLFSQETAPINSVAKRPAELFQNPIPYLPFHYKKIPAPPPQFLA
jgi:hypothetical protein